MNHCHNSAIVNRGECPTNFRDVSMANMNSFNFFYQDVGWDYFSFSTAQVSYGWLQWDSDRVAEQVLVECVGWSQGSRVIRLHSLMVCKVASAQKMHRGHPHSGYFWKGTSTTSRDGIDWARCPVLSEANWNSTTWEERDRQRERGKRVRCEASWCSCWDHYSCSSSPFL